MAWLKDDVALITGGGSGLGWALVERFLEEGSRVAILEKNQEKAAAARKHFGSEVLVTEGDVSLLRDNAKAVNAAVDRFGKLDTFIANAGIWDGMLSVLDLPEDRLEAAFDEVFAVNVRSLLCGARAAAKALLASRGNIIVTASNATFYPGGGGPIYTSSKHALLGMVRQLAYELAPKVRVNGVAPAAIASDLRGPAALGQAETSAVAGRNKADLIPLVPLQMHPEASDYTGTYVWLASRDNARTTTGTIIQADTGLSVRGLISVSGGMHL